MKRQHIALHGKTIMSILETSNFDRALSYVDTLIFRPLIDNGKSQFDEYDKKQFADIILEALSDENKSFQQLASDLGHYSKDWTIDWDWISHHVMWDNFNIRQAKGYLGAFGADYKVVKLLDRTASPCSCALYLTSPNDPHSEPKTFSLRELISNGCNLGRDAHNFKPVIGITDFGWFKYYPYGDETNEIESGRYTDGSTLISKPSGSKWDREKRSFELMEKDLTPFGRKVADLVKITFETEDGKIIPIEDWEKRKQ